MVEVVIGVGIVVLDYDWYCVECFYVYWFVDCVIFKVGKDYIFLLDISMSMFEI